MTQVTLRTFSPAQLVNEIDGRSFLMPTEIEVYIKNLIRIVDTQAKQIQALEDSVLLLRLGVTELV